MEIVIYLFFLICIILLRYKIYRLEGKILKTFDITSDTINNLIKSHNISVEKIKELEKRSK